MRESLSAPQADDAQLPLGHPSGRRQTLAPQKTSAAVARDTRAIPLGDAEEALVRKTAAKPDGGKKTSGDARAHAAGASRALALADFAPPSIGAGERLMLAAYRMGVPGSVLSGPFRKPAATRLLATAQSPLPGSRPAGVALRAGHFLVHGVKAPISQMDFTPSARLTPPFERTIHGFGWLRDLAASAPREQCTVTAERICAAWVKANPAIGKAMPWRVGLAARRLLAWLVHAPLILSGDKGLRGRMLGQIAETARWLDRNHAKSGDRLEDVAAWCAITAAGLMLPDGKPRRLFGEAGLVRALGELVGEDGGVLSRSPDAQMEALRLLVDCIACYRAVRADPPTALTAMMELLVPPLLSLTHADGSLGSWQGSGATGADELRALIGATGVRTRPLRKARGWGYQRVAAKGSVLQFDAAPPPLARHARTGCASTLAFEFSRGAHRLIVNCGGAAMAGGQIPVRIEQGLRATAAHSTLVLEDANSTAVLIGGKLGAGVGEVEIDRRSVGGEGGEGANGRTATRLEASHDGYASRFGLVHRRILMLSDDGDELRGEDVLVPSGRGGKRGKVNYAIRFHIGPGVAVSLSQDRKGARLALPDGTNWQFRTTEGELAIEDSMWSGGDGKPQAIEQLVIAGMISRSGANFSWLLKQMG